MFYENTIANEGLLKQIQPTLDQVVELQGQAVLDWFDSRQELEEELAGDNDVEQVKYLRDCIKKLQDIYTIPVNLSECTLVQTNVTRVRLTKEALHTFKTASHYKDYFSKETLRYNSFFFTGEIAQAAGHVIVLDDKSGKTYSVLHSELFEVTPPQEC